MQVHAVANSRKGVGQYSKWAATRHIRPPSDEATIQLLNEISERHDAPFLLVVSESDLVMVRAAQDGGRLRTLRALIPEARQLAIVQDKSATYDVARRIGLPVPVTWQPEPGPEPPPPPSFLEFPCILKWANAKEADKALSRIGLNKLKAEYCYSAGELARSLMRYSLIGQSTPCAKLLSWSRARPYDFHAWRRGADPVSAPPYFRMAAGGRVFYYLRKSAAHRERGSASEIGRVVACHWMGRRCYGGIPVRTAHRAGDADGSQRPVLGQPAAGVSRRCTFRMVYVRGLRNRASTWATCIQERPALPLHDSGDQTDCSSDKEPRSDPEPGAEVQRRFGVVEVCPAILHSPRSRYYVFSLRDPMPFLHDITGVLRNPGKRAL